MTPILDDAAHAQVGVGPLPRGGGGGAFTVNASSYHPDGFWQAHSPSLRVALDAGNWGNSLAINTPGQSGNPSSPHYRDLATSWSEGKCFPLLYRRQAVGKAARQVIQPVPAP